jgi:FkbM family methyltransferase
LPHLARSFPALPDRDLALSALAEIATAPCLFGPVATDGPLALYGAGTLGRLARDFLKAVGCDFNLALDRKAAELTKDPYWSGVQLLHPDSVGERTKSNIRLAVSLVASPYVEIEQSLLLQGFKDIVPFYDLAESFRHVHPLSNGWFSPPLTSIDQINTAKVLGRWDDDVSRAHHLQFLAWRRLREEWVFEVAPLTSSDRFFIPEIKRLLRCDEILLDAGAHHGSTTEAFLRSTNGAFGQVIAIEPDPSNRARLQDNLHSWLPDRSRVIVYDCALADKEGQAPFHEGLGYASQLSETGHLQVTVRSLDGLGLSPTFVKLHLEGWELAALKGARRTLLSSRPIIAATVYHNADGIWRTPLWLMETLPDYRFLFRLDSWCGTGAVVYAIPNERFRDK